MSEVSPLVEKEQIAVGKPLPFSVFSGDSKLLLAKGQLVESERAREMLVKNGVFRSGTPSPARPVLEQGDVQFTPEQVLAELRGDYDRGENGQRFVVTMAPSETHDAYTAWVLGIHNQTMILTAPVKSDGSIVAVTPGQSWLCRTFQVTSAFRFRASILKVAFEPFPHLHVEIPKQVEKRKVRGRPRANVYLPANIVNGTTSPCVVIDLSVGGGRVAMDARTELEKGQEVVLKTQIELMEYKFDLAIKCTIAGAFGPSDPRHPRAAFYGLKFEALSELESLVLHGYVSGQLAIELNSLWQVLASASPMNGSDDA
jgi:hypothetical protein